MASTLIRGEGRAWVVVCRSIFPSGGGRWSALMEFFVEANSEKFITDNN